VRDNRRLDVVDWRGVPDPKQPASGDRDDGGLTARIGRLALRPVRAVAHAGRGALSDEAERALDGVMAGPLPEAVGRSLVEHRVVERFATEVLEARAADAATATPTVEGERAEQLVREALDNPEIERMPVDAIHSRLTTELANEITQSPAFKRVLTNVMTSPEVRHAFEKQTAGLGADVAAVSRKHARRADDSVEKKVLGWLRRPRAKDSPVPFAGVGTRGTALATDAIIVAFLFVVGGALIGLVASLFGGLRPTWLAGLLAGVGWALVVVVYFVGFWSTVGQTPGMNLMRVRVVSASGEAPSGWRSLLRLVGLALSVIFFFTGFLPALVDARRQALPDFMADTTVVYDDPDAVQP
jgi:uncharacterized RDD family membrane protein YckC